MGTAAAVILAPISSRRFASSWDLNPISVYAMCFGLLLAWIPRLNWHLRRMKHAQSCVIRFGLAIFLMFLGENINAADESLFHSTLVSSAGERFGEVIEVKRLQHTSLVHVTMTEGGGTAVAKTVEFGAQLANLAAIREAAYFVHLDEWRVPDGVCYWIGFVPNREVDLDEYFSDTGVPKPIERIFFPARGKPW